MSTKTSIKRIALVAAAALTLGGFSVISAGSAHAAQTISLACITADGGSQGDDKITCNGVAGAANTVTVKVLKNASKRTSVVVTGGTFTLGTDSGTATVLNATSGATGAVVATGGALDYVNLIIPTPTTGTITVADYLESSNSGIYSSTADKTVTITVNAASAIGTVSTANTKVYISDSSTVESTSVSTASTAGALLSADSTVLGVSTANTLAGAIYVALKDTQSNGGVAMQTKDVTASITGAGLLKGTGTGAYSSYGSAARAVTSGTDGSGQAMFQVFSDGSSGVGTITITYTSASGTTTTLATKTVTFYSSTVASVKATQVLKVGSTSGAELGNGQAVYDGVSNQPALVVQLLDSNGNSVSGASANIKILSSDTTVYASSVTHVIEETSAGLYGKGYYDVSISSQAGSTSGATASITAYVLAADAVTKISATPLTFAVGKATASTATLTLDAASYAPGDKVTATITLKDSAGNAVADGTYNVFAAPTSPSTQVLTPSAQITSSPFGSSTGNVTVTGGVKTATFYAPFSAGTFILTGTTGTTGLATALQATTISATASITGIGGDSSLALDAANAATDAANNAYDEAQNATQAASDALAAVKALAVQVKALIALVTKIKNKVGA